MAKAMMSPWEIKTMMRQQDPKVDPGMKRSAWEKEGADKREGGMVAEPWGKGQGGDAEQPCHATLPGSKFP